MNAIEPTFYPPCPPPPRPLVHHRPRPREHLPSLEEIEAEKSHGKEKEK